MLAAASVCVPDCSGSQGLPLQLSETVSQMESKKRIEGAARDLASHDSISITPEPESEGGQANTNGTTTITEHVIRDTWDPCSQGLSLMFDSE